MANHRDTGARFVTTAWSQLLSVGRVDGPEVDKALEDLCRSYWPPLYALLRHEGKSPEDSKDLVQGFLTRLIERRDLEQISPLRGRFRDFLWISLRNYVIKQAERDATQKRGGGRSRIDIDGAEAEYVYGADPRATSPDQACDRTFARMILRRGMVRLEAEAEARGRKSEFTLLAPVLDGNERGEYASIASAIGVTPALVASKILRMRSRLREFIA